MKACPECGSHTTEEIRSAIEGTYECEECGEMHANEFSVTCRRCDFERESGDTPQEDE